ncbi:MAG TPA: hypothetical protein VMS43_12500 [Allosphingosinicella sp.]|nr:hypothetical protein [Allosphingosinicella sp.]
MDETFQLRARRSIGPASPAPLDFQMLSSALIARQAATPAARAQAAFDRNTAPPPDAEPLVETVLAGPQWRQAASAQRFCFNRAEVKRRHNAP